MSTDEEKPNEEQFSNDYFSAIKSCHLQKLTSLLQKYENIKIWNLKTIEDYNGMTFTYFFT